MRFETHFCSFCCSQGLGAHLVGSVVVKSAVVKGLMKGKSECNLLPHIDVFPAKTGLSVGTFPRYEWMFTVANRAECALCPSSTPADVIAVCEYTEQYNQSTAQLCTPQDDVIYTGMTLSNISRTSTTVIG